MLFLHHGAVGQLNSTEALRRCPGAYKSTFDIINYDPNVPSFLRAKYQLFYGDLIRRLKCDMTILDFNYTRLDQYMKRLAEEQMVVFNLRPDETLRLGEREYPLALEFFLQFDGMSFVGACSHKLNVDVCLACRCSKSILHENMPISLCSPEIHA